MFPSLKPTTSLLLFALLINFFQYVKELFNPGSLPLRSVPYLRAFVTAPVMVENNGVEPLTSCVQGRRSSQLS